MYFLRFAFDQIYAACTCTDETYSFDDFWILHDRKRKKHPIIDLHETPGFQLGRWLRQFELFINYFAEHIFPLYDWCFLSLLMDSIETEFPAEPHHTHVQRALELLAKYMEANYTDMITPISLDDCDGVNLFATKNIRKFQNNFTRNELDTLAKHLIQNGSHEQNMTPINRSKYRPKNRKELHDFYIQNATWLYGTAQDSTKTQK